MSGFTKTVLCCRGSEDEHSLIAQYCNSLHGNDRSHTVSEIFFSYQKLYINRILKKVLLCFCP